MRNAFADALLKLADLDERIVLLSGDIGNRVFDSFKQSHPKNFYNCGVAEANMASVAAGLAQSGLRPIIYTITPFVTTRCLEQIRVDICYHNLPVVIVGVGSGLSYASLGGTHHSCEDISFLRSLPNITVVSPADPLEVRVLLKLVLRHQGPVYFRMGKKNEPLIHQTPPTIKLGKASVLKPGKEVCLISTGSIVSMALSVADLLEKQNISTSVVNFHTIKPLDAEFLMKLKDLFSFVVTIEEHSLIGGLGTSLLEWFCDHSITDIHLLRIALPDHFPKKVGSQAYLREQLELTPEKILKKIQSFINKYHENKSCDFS